MTKKGTVLLTSATSLALGALVTAAALAPTYRPQQDRPQFSVASELVVLNVAVTDQHGEYLPDLSAESFRVMDEGKPQRVSFFTREDAPATVGLLVDDSGSMWPNLDRVLSATRAFAESSNAEDELFVIAFNEHVRNALPASEPFTNDSRVLREASARVLHGRGRTAMFDAISAGLDYLQRGQWQRRVLVLLGDGGDNASSVTLDEAMARAQTSNAVIYSVALVEPADTDSNPKLLRNIAEATGGTSFAPRTGADISAALERIARDIRGSYTIGYEPAIAGAGGFRKLKVIVDPPDHRKVVVRTRSGYLAKAGSERP